jgi:hypothetical protein
MAGTEAGHDVAAIVQTVMAVLVTAIHAVHELSGFKMLE